MAQGQALAIPGSQALAIAAQPATGIDALDPRFLSMLLEAKIPQELCKLLGDAGVDSAPLFGKMCKDGAAFEVPQDRAEHRPIGKTSGDGRSGPTSNGLGSLRDSRRRRGQGPG